MGSSLASVLLDQVSNDEEDQVVCYLGQDVGVGHGDDDGKYNSGGPGDDLFPLGHSPKGSPTVEGWDQIFDDFDLFDHTHSIGLDHNFDSQGWSSSHLEEWTDEGWPY